MNAVERNKTTVKKGCVWSLWLRWSTTERHVPVVLCTQQHQ